MEQSPNKKMGFSGLRKNRIIGVEIGSNTLKFAECAGREVKKMAVARLPENLTQAGKVTAPTALTAFLKDMLKEAGIQPGPCALVLPSQAVVGHKVSLPLMNQEEIMLNLPYEFKDFLGKSISKYEFDYVVLGSYENMLSLYAAAVPTEVIDLYYDVLGKAGLKLKYAVPAEMAWLNLIRTAENAPDRLCILDMGHAGTRVSIFHEDQYEIGSNIDRGGLTLDYAISNKDGIDVFLARTRKEADMEDILADPVCTDLYTALGLDVMRMVNFYRNSTDGGSELRDIYYCGGSSNIGALRDSIAAATDCRLHHIKELVHTGADNEEQALYCALAAGAALQAAL